MRLCAPHFGADVPVAFQVLFPDDLAAAFTLLPQTFGADLAILVIQFGEFVVVPFVPLEPRHSSPTLTRVGTLEQMSVHQRTAATTLRVWMPAQSREAAINLLGQHGARQFVRKRHGGERDQLVRARRPAGAAARRGRRSETPGRGPPFQPSRSARANPAESIGLPAGSRKILRAEGVCPTDRPARAGSRAFHRANNGRRVPGNPPRSRWRAGPSACR